MNKLVLSIALVPILVGGVFLGGAEETMNVAAITMTAPQQQFEQYPPYVKRYWVEKLKTPLETGENLIFTVLYESDDS